MVVGRLPYLPSYWVLVTFQGLLLLNFGRVNPEKKTRLPFQHDFFQIPDLRFACWVVGQNIRIIPERGGLMVLNPMVESVKKTPTKQIQKIQSLV